MTELIAWAAGAAGGLGFLAAFARWIVRPVWRFFQRLQEFLRDWFGEEPRPGFEGRPGIPERIDHIERHVGNGSDEALRDVVDDTRRTLAAHLKWADEQSRVLAAVTRRVDLDGEDWTDQEEEKLP